MSISISRVYLGYCSNCEDPSNVGDILIKGWPHVLPICPGCLRKMADQVNKSSTVEKNG